MRDTVKGQLKVLGIDLAKQSFQLHGVDEQHPLQAMWRRYYQLNMPFACLIPNLLGNSDILVEQQIAAVETDVTVFLIRRFHHRNR